MEVLQEFHEGIIALSACLAGEVLRFILEENEGRSEKSGSQIRGLLPARAIIFWNCRITVSRSVR